MDIPGISSSNSSTDPAPVGKKTLGKQEFLTLLLKQLSCQDPLNPLDNTEFTAQLTQFSTLEELTNIRSTLNDVLDFQHSMQNATVTNLIGKSVEVPGNSTYLEDAADMRYTLSGDAKSVRIAILDKSGTTVRTDDIGPKEAGKYNYVWDGKDSFGKTMTEGTYSFEVTALDGSDKVVETSTDSSGKVTGVLFEDEMTYLVLDGNRNVYLSDIKSINQ
jgi:flagellar basal-body rod modification protein FlgD